MKLIKPHGGKLVNKEVTGAERRRLINRAVEMPRLQLSARAISDLEMIATGAYSPLEGFMDSGNYKSVLSRVRLADGTAWSIPITLAVSDEQVKRLREGHDVALYQEEHLLGVLHLIEKFSYDKNVEAQSVYQTTAEAHPGVRALYAQGDWLLAGTVSLINRPLNLAFQQYRLAPLETRTLFQQNGWRRVVAFQTRNPVHRAHEYIQKCALEIADGLLLHPLVGETKSDDVPAEVRIRSYEEILAHYYPASRTVLAVMPAAMRYAGPREAIFHALVRKNYGCSHFIVGRDHAGVGNYYGTYDAHHIFDEFEPAELGITPLFFDHAFYCRSCGAMASSKTCPHDQANHVTLSGTRVRELLSAGKLPPVEFSRPEVARVLIDAYGQ
jgi:sulfate adenylyltransferase